MLLAPKNGILAACPTLVLQDLINMLLRQKVVISPLFTMGGRRGKGHFLSLPNLVVFWFVHLSLDRAFGFELCCVLGEDTLISQCLAPPKGVTLLWTGIPSRGK